MFISKVYHFYLFEKKNISKLLTFTQKIEESMSIHNMRA